jgi:hypothetical protein
MPVVTPRQANPSHFDGQDQSLARASPSARHQTVIWRGYGPAMNKRNLQPSIRILLILLIFPALTLATPPADQPQATPRAENRTENYCLGGIEDRKIIVDDSQVTNPFKQTTFLGCEVDGGNAQTMPDLPSPTAERHILA